MADKVVKILSRKTEKRFNYAPEKGLVEELRIFEKQTGLPIFQAIKILMTKKVDSLSFTRDSPYTYFYARRKTKTITFKIQTQEIETDFEIAVKLLKQES